MSAVNDLLGIPLYDYIRVASLTGAIMQLDTDNIHLLCSMRNNNKDIVVMVPNQVISMLGRSPRLFEDCYYADGIVYHKTATGYKALALPEEVFV